MNRTITLLWLTLTLRTPGGVTAPETHDSVDLPLARGPEHLGGAPYTPPTSLAGALRSHLGPDAIRFLGPPPGHPDLSPSPVRLLGSRVTLPDGAEETIVRSTAIDPDRAAAAVSTLRSRTVLPAGTQIRAYLRCDDATLAQDLAPRLHSWQPVIGRGRTTGHGRAEVTQIALRTLDLTTADGLATWLFARPEDLFPDDAGQYQLKAPDRTSPPEPTLTAVFQIVDPLVIGTEKTGTSGTPRPIYRQDGAPAVPGSTWKGILRARCAYILRSCEAPICVPDQPCQTCPICRLFGYTRRGAAPGQPTGQAGSLIFQTSPIADAQVAVRNHVAIDRFTGGARAGLFYSHEAVTAGTLSLVIHAQATLDDADRGLLLLALRDVHDGLVGIGGATTRGYGTLRLADKPSRRLLHQLAPGHAVGDAVRRLLRNGAA